jgi:hypothetical protein
MVFKSGDLVVHKSDKKLRRMVVVYHALKTPFPENIHDEMANLGMAIDGSYYCTWIYGTKKGEGYFTEIELELQ